MIKVTNKEVAEILREIAAAYEVKGEDRFRIAAYNNAADSIEHAGSEIKDIWEDKNLEEIPGIGKSISAYLDEFFRKGSVKHFEEVKKDLPKGMFPLLKVPSIGPKTAYKLAKELKVKNIHQLRWACENHKVAQLEGFGTQSEKEILKSIFELERREGRVLLVTARQIAERYITYLKGKSSVLKADPLGSIRRWAPTIGDIDIAISTREPVEVIDHFTSYPEVEKILSKGEKKASVILKNSYQVDLMTQKPEAYGSLLQHFTGSKNHNIHLRKVAQEKGLSLSEYGIKQKSGTIAEYSTEEKFYSALKMDWVPPELREDKGEIEAAQLHKLPKTVELKDVKGDLQMHTEWSDGANTAVEMVKKGQDLGYAYIGISDHAPSIRAHGKAKVLKTVREWKKKIERINRRHSELDSESQSSRSRNKFGMTRRRLKVLFGVEVNIAADVSIALPDDILAEFDYCVGSIHTGFRQDKEKITQRLIMALKNPYITFIGHPTGRLLEQREGYEVDWGRVFEACLKYNKWLEINAYPDRLDISDTVAREAKNKGVKLIINTDAHQRDQLEFMEFGVSVARRGWCEKRHIVNTLPLKQFLAEIEKGRGK